MSRPVLSAYKTVSSTVLVSSFISAIVTVADFPESSGTYQGGQFYYGQEETECHESYHYTHRDYQ